MLLKGAIVRKRNNSPFFKLPISLIEGGEGNKFDDNLLNVLVTTSDTIEKKFVIGVNIE